MERKSVNSSVASRYKALPGAVRPFSASLIPESILTSVHRVKHIIKHTVTDTTMTEDDVTYDLVDIKVLSSSCITKLSAILEIKDSWNANNEADVATFTEVGLQCEYAKTAFEDIATLTEQLLRDLPPYEPNSDLRSHRLLEISIQAYYTKRHITNVMNMLPVLGETMALVRTRRMSEFELRVRAVRRDIDDLRDSVSELRSMDEEGDESGRGSESESEAWEGVRSESRRELAMTARPHVG